MFRPRRGFCQNWAWLVLQAALYGSWILGLFPLTYNSRSQQMSRSRRLQLYGLILNVLLILLLLYAGYEARDNIKMEAYQRNPLLLELNIFMSMLALLSAIVVHSMNFLGSNNVLWIVNELLTLENHHFADINSRNCPKLNCFVIQKSVTIVGSIFTLLAANYGIPGYAPSLPMTVLMCLAQVVLSLNATHCYMGVLFIYRYVWLINGQLLDLANQLRMDPGSDFRATRIRELLALYRRLLELNRRLQSAYELQLSLLMSTGLVGNIGVIFFLIVLVISMGKVSIFLMVFPQSLLINIWDFWLCIAVCNLNERTGRGTSTILKLFSDLDNLDVELERSLDEFAWLCSHAKFRFQLFGLFSINYNMGFQMLITSILYLVYLVQLDYMNL